MKYFSFLILLISNLTLSAQEWNLSGAYQYIYSPEWDKAIQRYNFSRPFLDEVQPLLVHGTFLETSYFFKNEKRIQSGIKIDYGFTRSSAENPELDIAFHLHQIGLGYAFRYSFQKKPKNIVLEGDITIFSTILSKRINQEIEMIDEEAKRALGIGGSLGFKLLYLIKTEHKIKISPFAGISYSPYLSSSESESILDPTISVNGTGDIHLLSCQLGIRISFKNSN